jgi:hypothetical protein
MRRPCRTSIANIPSTSVRARHTPLEAPELRLIDIRGKAIGSFAGLAIRSRLEAVEEPEHEEREGAE